MWRAIALLAALVGSPAQTAVAADSDAERIIRFYNAIDDDLTALALLDYYRDDFAQPAEVSLLQAEILLEQGLVEPVAAALRPHLQHADNGVRSRARFVQGKLKFRQGDYAEAVTQLEQAKAALSPALRDERRYYLAQSWLSQEQTGKAADAITAMSERSPWTPHAYFNLAMAYAGSHFDPERAYLALRVADSLAPSHQEGMTLRDRANLAAGHLALKTGEPEKALNFLRKVRIDSPFAAEALYEYGRAYAAAGQMQAAVEAWGRVKVLPMASPGVAESLNGLAYAYKRLGLDSRVVDVNYEAGFLFKQELAYLENLMKDVRKNGLADTVLSAQTRDLEWFLRSDSQLNTPKDAYILRLMRDAAFYQEAALYLDMRRVAMRLRQWQARLEVHRQALQQRLQRVQGERGRLLEWAQAERFNQLIEQRNQLAADYKAVQQQVDTRSNAVFTTVARDIQQLDQALQAFKQRLASLEDSMAQAPTQFRNLLTRVEALQGQLNGVLAEFDAWLADQDATLTELALRKLETLRQGLYARYVTNQETIAYFYDFLARDRLTSAEPAP